MRLSRDTSVRLAQYLGTEAPAPMHPKYYHKQGNLSSYCDKNGDGVAAYSLDDIFDKQFCEIFAKRWKGNPRYHRQALDLFIDGYYYGGGMPELELNICQMIEGKP